LIGGATYDTGMLIALERNEARAWAVHERLVRREIPIIAPDAVIAEWWRGRTDDREDLLAQLRAPTRELATRAARVAGEALAAVRPRRGDDEGCRCKHLVDAIVMASAAVGECSVVYTADVDDLMRLQSFFPSVRVLRV
jgi:predicted nucleic acid-binding protein